MIQIICGKKGSGKTKRIIDSANLAAEECDGNVVFLFYSQRYIFNLKHQVRFIDTSEFEIVGAYLFLGFISGLAASNFDLKKIYIDGFLKHMDRPLSELEDFFVKLEKFSTKFNIDIIISIGEDKQQIPEFMSKYLID